MEIEEFRKLEKEINDECKFKLHELRLDYVNKNKKFNLGDFICNRTGIMKVEKISYDIFFNNIQIVYYGYRYKNIKKILSRKKDNKIMYLNESYSNIKLVEYESIQ